MRTTIIAALAALSACALHAARTNVTASTTYVDARVTGATNALPAWTKSPAKPAYTAQEVGAATPSDVLEEVRNATNALPAWTKSPAKPVYTAVEVGAVDGGAVTNIVRRMSLAGIYDDELGVWWTPHMRNGAYYWTATTNVNLAAEVDE